MAQIAVAIAILTVAPVRLANLTAIRLGTNLIKPDGREKNYWLVFPDYDVKNRVKLEYPLQSYLTRLIDEYVFGRPYCGGGTRTGCSRDNAEARRGKSRSAGKSPSVSTRPRACG
jgi:hypothetical protein